MSRVLVPFNAKIPKKYLTLSDDVDASKNTVKRAMSPAKSFMVDDTVTHPNSLNWSSLSRSFFFVARITSLVSPDLILTECCFLWIVYLSKRFGIDSILYRLGSSITESFKKPTDKQKEDEDVEWNRWESHSLPAYITLCNMVHQEMTNYICLLLNAGNNAFVRNAVSFFGALFSYVLPAHLFTDVGRVFWYIVLEKYFIFLLVSVGIWTDQCVEGYNLAELIHKEGVDSSVVLDDKIDVDYKYRALALYRQDRRLQNKDAFPVSDEINLEDIWDNLSSSEQDELLSRAKSIVLDNNEDTSEDGAGDVAPGKASDEWNIWDFLFKPADIKDVELVEVQENIEHEGDSENIVDEMDITEDDRDFNSSWDFILHRLSCWNFWLMGFNEVIVDDKEREDNSSFIDAFVGTRAVLILIIPYLSPFSIFAMGIAARPFIILTTQSNYAKLFPSYWVTNCMERAEADEMAEGNHTQSAESRGVVWHIVVRAMHIFWEQSRFIQFSDNCCQFAFTMGILYGDPVFWLLFSFFVIVPSIFFRTLDIFFIIGKKMRIHDSDFPECIRKLYDINYSVESNEDELVESAGLDRHAVL